MIASGLRAASPHGDIPKAVVPIKDEMGPPDEVATNRPEVSVQQQGPSLPGFNANIGHSPMDLAAACSSAITDAHRLFDFWSEDENKRFISAIDSFQYPPDIKAVAERMGGKSVEQTNSYAALYIEALNHHRTAALAQGKPTDFHICAADVYSYHGVGSLYIEDRRQKGQGNSSESSSAASSASTDRKCGMSGMSIDFLCGSCDAAPEPPKQQLKAKAQPVMPSMSSVLDTAVLHQHLQRSGIASLLTTEQLVSPDSHFAAALQQNIKQYLARLHPRHMLAGAGLAFLSPQTVQAAQQQASYEQHMGMEGQNGHLMQEVGQNGQENGSSSSSGLPSSSAGWGHHQAEGAESKIGWGQQQTESCQEGKLGKRKRLDVEEKSMEEMHDEIEKMRVPPETLWAFSSMVDGCEKPHESPAHKNPWEWSRKMIAKQNGYSQWIPLFAEHIVLSKREVSDDMRTIRIKAPPPPQMQAEDSNPYNKKVGAEGSGKKGGAGAFEKKGARKQQQGERKQSGPEPPAKLQRVSNKGDDEGGADVAATKPRGGGRWPNGAGGPTADKTDYVPSIGDSVEVKWEGEWWEASVKKVKLPADRSKQQVYVSYVGGTEAEEEWIPLNRIRVPKNKGAGASKETSPPPAKVKGQGRWPNKGDKGKSKS